jgi:hypothetical protein
MTAFALVCVCDFELFLHNKRFQTTLGRETKETG